jgi:hypothetical protein
VYNGFSLRLCGLAGENFPLEKQSRKDKKTKRFSKEKNGL